MNDQVKQTRTFKLRTLNIIFLSAVGVLCLFLTLFTGHLLYQFQTYVWLSEQHSIISTAALELQASSDYLTEEVRLFVLSYDFKHVENYFNETKVVQRRNKAVEKIRNIAESSVLFPGIDKNDSGSSASESLLLLQKALDESNQLEQMEYQAMKLVLQGTGQISNPNLNIPEEILNTKLSSDDENLAPQYKIPKAWIILFSQEYLQSKLTISDYKTKAIQHILNKAKIAHDKRLDELKSVFIMLMLCIAGIFITNLIFFFGIIRLVIRPLYSFIKDIGNNKKLKSTKTKEFNILSDTYNMMYDKNEANEILLRHKAEHDELTGLMNRAAFSQLKVALTNSEEDIALIIIDVDSFKTINDTKGHETGDKILKHVAETLLKNFRTSDYVCRVGGDEFCVILTQCDIDHRKTEALISSKMSRIKEELSKGLDEISTITLSAGIALSQEGWSEDLYNNADKALYRVKGSGKNNFGFYIEDF